ncbi:MAG TPA: hypothetical protein VF272_01080 [Candidatus Saccharimonadia bacterium]
MQRLGLVLAGVWMALPLPVLAGDTTKTNLCTGAGGAISGTGCDVPGKGLTGDQGFVLTITNTLMTVAGAIAVIIIITAGIRYITSTGDAARVKASKDTLMYAVIGLIVVILAYAIVRFIATSIG